MSPCEELALLVKKYVEVSYYEWEVKKIEPEVAKSMIEKAEEILKEGK